MRTRANRRRLSAGSDGKTAVSARTGIPNAAGFVAVLALAALAAACARQGPPPGGPEDVRPPVIVATVPESFSTETEFDGPVRFEFDERISERVAGGEMDRAVIVSPRTGGVRVNHGRGGLSVELDGGFRPDRVYRVTVLPGISDLFGNAMRDPFEIVFSTGPELAPTVVAGMAWDRIQGGPIRGAEIFATPAGGGDPFVARSDEEGIYALRYLPEGVYALTPFLDRNRNGELDAMEPQGRVDVALGATDTLFLNLPVLAADTTPAVPVSVTPLDSVTLLVEFDDHMEAELEQPLASASVLRVVDSTTLEVEEILPELAYSDWASGVADSLFGADSIAAVESAVEDSIRRAELALADSLAPTSDSIAAPDDSAAVPSDTEAGVAVDPAAAAESETTGEEPETVAEPVEDPGPRPPVAVDGRPARRPPPPDAVPTYRTGPGGERLPSMVMVVRLLDPLQPGTVYSVSVSGVMNINGVSEGGGAATFETEAEDTTGDGGTPPT